MSTATPRTVPTFPTVPPIAEVPVRREGFDGRGRVSVLATSDPPVRLRVSTFETNAKTYATGVLGMRLLDSGNYLTSPLHGETVAQTERHARFNAKHLDAAHAAGLAAVLAALTADPDRFAGVLAHTPDRD